MFVQVFVRSSILSYSSHARYSSLSKKLSSSESDSDLYSGDSNFADFNNSPFILKYELEKLILSLHSGQFSFNNNFF